MRLLYLTAVIGFMTFAGSCLAQEAPAVSQETAPTTDDNTVNEQQAAISNTLQQPIGVPECDNFMDKFTECTDKMPPEAKAAYQQTIAGLKDRMMELSAKKNPELSSLCTQMAGDANANNSFKTEGCKF